MLAAERTLRTRCVGVRRPLFVLLAFLLFAVPAGAATLEVSPPVKVAAGGADPALVLLADGGAVVAWRAPDGLHAARRGPGGAFGAPQRLHEGPVLELRMAASPDGRLALGWVTGTLGVLDEQRQVRLAMAPPGEAFGEAVDVPGGTTGQLVQPHVAVAADGTTAVGFQRSTVSTEHPIVVLRAPDGTFGEPQVLDAGVINGPSLRADGNGGILAMWSGYSPGTRGTLIRVADRAPRAPAFGAPATLSSPSTNADNNSSPPALAVNGRGDALVAWSPMPITDFALPGASVAWTSHRAAGGSWSAPQEMAVSGNRPHVALNARGDGILVGEAGLGVGAAFRPAGGAFEFDWPAPLKHGLSMNVPVALDDAGNAVAVNAATPPAPAPGIAAVIRPPAGCFGEEVDVSPRGSATSAPSLALRGDGTGAVAWSSADGVHLTDLRVLPGGRTKCPPGTPARPGPSTPPDSLPISPMRVSKLPSSVRRRVLWRDGIRFRVRSPKGSSVAAGLMPAGQFGPRLVRADARVSRRGVATLRMRMRRSTAALLPRGTKLDLWIFASTPRHQSATKIHKLTIR